MGNVLRVLVVTLVVASVVGFASFAVWAVVTANNHPAPLPPNPPGPPAPPLGETYNIYFQNNRSAPIYIVPTYGTITDGNSWTNWVQDPNQTNPQIKLDPHTSSLVPLMIAAGAQGFMTVFIGGMASVKFIVRTDCVLPYMICGKGDSTYAPSLDGPKNNLNRGTVPMKPEIDTTIEMTCGCSYTGTTNCSVNPSCVSTAWMSSGGSPPQCYTDLSGVMTDSSYLIHEDGLLYHNGVNIPLPASTVLNSNMFFDLSCVDGFTVPIMMQLRRPATATNQSSTFCNVSAASDIPIDNASSTDWQTVGGTSGFTLSQCPTNEVIWPSPHNITYILPGTDGYNTATAGDPQIKLPYLVAPTGGALLQSTLVPGSTLNLNYYRDPREVQAVGAGGPFNINQVIGCAGPCSALTKNLSISQMYPYGDGTATGGHVFTGQPTYMIATGTVLGSTMPGVADVCCVNAGVVDNITDQCNTSKYWIAGVNGATTTVPNFAYGYYANVFAPTDSSPWFTGTHANPESINPYGGQGNVSSYVTMVRGGVTGQRQTTRVYAYPVDDQYNTVICNSSDAYNVSSQQGGRGPFYLRYDVKFVILPDT